MSDITPNSVDLWSALPVPVLLTDRAGTLRDANPAARALIGGSGRGAPLCAVLGAAPELARAMNRLGGTVSGSETGAEIGTSMQLHDVALRLPSGRTLRAQVSVEPLPTDQALIVLQPRPEPPALSAPHAAIGMAEMLAHEIKNPLAGIIGAAQLLQMDVDASGQALTQLIVDECRRVVTLLDQVDQFGDHRPSKAAPVNLHDALRRAYTSANLALERPVDIVEHYDPSLPEAWADPDQLQQIFQNLILNAAQAGASVMTLRTAYDPSARRWIAGETRAVPLVVSVADNGPGIPPNLRDHVFDPFVSGRENGTGLGLALVAKLIDDNGAVLRLDDDHRGCVFRMCFARAPQMETR